MAIICSIKKAAPEEGPLLRLLVLMKLMQSWAA
jgi:hypothetical protein